MLLNYKMDLFCKNDECENLIDNWIKHYGYCCECFLRNRIICQVNRKCIICNNSLVAIKSERKNGGSGKDWKKRILHIKCFKQHNKR